MPILKEQSKQAEKKAKLHKGISKFHELVQSSAKTA
jgi:hypothetical protein